MSERFFETPKQLETPETNVKMAALKLLRHKALVNLAEGRTSMCYIEDVNEIMIVAGLPVIAPEELQAKEVDVIKVEKEEPEYGDTI